MRLEDYLAALERCPDEELTDELGVYDNFPIFLSADFKVFVEWLQGSGKYRLEKIIRKQSGNESGTDWIFVYVPGVVKIQAFDYVAGGSAAGILDSSLLSEYDMTLMLHTYQATDLEWVRRLRVSAIVIEELGRFIIERDVAACMPRSVGSRYVKPFDYSKIVYHTPSSHIGVVNG